MVLDHVQRARSLQAGLIPPEGPVTRSATARQLVDALSATDPWKRYNKKSGSDTTVTPKEQGKPDIKKLILIRPAALSRRSASLPTAQVWLPSGAIRIHHSRDGRVSFCRLLIAHALSLMLSLSKFCKTCQRFPLPENNATFVPSSARRSQQRSLASFHGNARCEVDPGHPVSEQVVACRHGIARVRCS